MTVMVSESNAIMAGDALPWWRLRSPSSLAGFLVTYVVMFIPAIIGFSFDWPWAIWLALMLPGMVAHEVLALQAARVRGIRVRQQLPSDKRLAFLGAVAVALAAIAVGFGLPKDAVPLGVGVAFLVVVEPVWRLEWKHHDARARKHSTPFGN